MKFFFIIILLNSTILYSQSTGIIKGSVIDKKTRRNIEGASLIIEGTDKGTSTNIKGKFEFRNIPYGKYKVEVSFMGYHSTIKEIEVSNSKSPHLTFLLKEKIEALEEVIVNTKPKLQKIRNQTMPVSVILMKQLQGTVSNVQDVLMKTVGITVRSTGGEGSTSKISIRGLEGKRIGFFIDGTPLNDYSDFVNINDVPVEMIERIEIYKGIVPAKLGGSAMGGAVNIIVKEYPPRYIDANYTIGSFNTHKFSLILKLNPDNKGYELGLGSYLTYSDNDYKMQLPFDDGLIVKRDHDRFKNKLFGGSLKFFNKWFDKIELEPIFIETYKEKQGIEYNIQHAYSKSKAYTLVNNIEKKDFFTEGLDFDWSLIYAFTMFNFFDTAPHRTNWEGKHYNPVSEFGGEIGNSGSRLESPKHVLIHKLNFNYSIDKKHTINLNSVLNLAYTNPEDPIKDKVIGYKTNHKSNMSSWVLGLNHDYRSTNDKFLNSFTAKYYRYNLKTKITNYFRTEDKHMDKYDFGISNAFRYQFTSRFLCKFSLAYEVRLPSEKELFGDGYMTAPSDNLIPERNTSLNIGFLYYPTGRNTNNLHFELNSYYTYIENMIRYTGDYLKSQYQNFGEMRVMGTEVEIRSNISNFLYGYMNFTYQDLRDTRKHEANSSNPNPTKGSRMPNIPYFMVNTGIEFHKDNLFGGKKQNSKIFINSSFTGKYFYDFRESAYQERSIPSAFCINTGFEQSFVEGSYFIIFRIDNITNTRLLSELNRPLSGRKFSLRLRYVLK